MKLNYNIQVVVVFLVITIFTCNASYIARKKFASYHMMMDY